MGYKVSFLDNQSVTAQDLNLIGAGMPNVSYQTFQDGTPYGVDDLNEITASLMNPGVAKNYGLMCSTSISNGILHINPGRAFFASGATITVDSSGIDLAIPESNQTQYVYFFYSANGNIAGAKIAETKEEADTVELATISSNGTLTDTRQYAYNKHASVLPNCYQDTTLQIASTSQEREYVIDFDAGFKKIIVEKRAHKSSGIEVIDKALLFDMDAGKRYDMGASSKAPYAYFSKSNFTSGEYVGFTEYLLAAVDIQSAKLKILAEPYYNGTVFIHFM